MALPLNCPNKNCHLCSMDHKALLTNNLLLQFKKYQQKIYSTYIRNTWAHGSAKTILGLYHANKEGNTLTWTLQRKEKCDGKAPLMSI